MEVIIAKKAGFCFGVRRAIQMVEDAIAGETPVYSLGPVIHNPQVMQQLKENGLREEEDLGAINEGVVIIRSHGVPLHIYREIEEKGLTVVDTTCPFVKKMHRKARSLFQEGYQLIIVGDRHHPEITSLTDDPHFQALVISHASELDGVSLSKKLGLISQTTQPTENFNEVAGRLLPEASELKIFNTICDSTITRQLEAREIAAQVEAMIIIGGRNSANTRRLVKICQESGTRTFWVETASELQPQMVDGLKSAGLTAGASTPKWIIDEVVTRLNVLTSRSTRAGITLPVGR